MTKLEMRSFPGDDWLYIADDWLCLYSPYRVHSKDEVLHKGYNRFLIYIYDRNLVKGNVISASVDIARDWNDGYQEYEDPIDVYGVLSRVQDQNFSVMSRYLTKHLNVSMSYTQSRYFTMGSLLRPYFRDNFLTSSSDWAKKQINVKVGHMSIPVLPDHLSRKDKVRAFRNIRGSHTYKELLSKATDKAKRQGMSAYEIIDFQVLFDKAVFAYIDGKGPYPDDYLVYDLIQKVLRKFDKIATKIARLAMLKVALITNNLKLLIPLSSLATASSNQKKTLMQAFKNHKNFEIGRNLMFWKNVETSISAVEIKGSSLVLHIRFYGPIGDRDEKKMMKDTVYELFGSFGAGGVLSDIVRDYPELSSVVYGVFGDEAIDLRKIRGQYKMV